MAWLYPILINKAGHFYAAIVLQVVDQTRIAHITIDHGWTMHLYGLNDGRAIFMTSIEGQILCIG